MAPATRPSAALARRASPAPLWRALRHLFAQGLTDTMLVGGTALAGFYAAHRRSDDLDLFTASSSAHAAAVLAARSLGALGAQLSAEQRTAQYYRALCTLEAHHFSIDIVHDANLFRVGEALLVEGLAVASLETLLMQKAATLVSRCSEKDLFDLRWLVSAQPAVELKQLIALGQRVDAGVDAESMLLVLSGTVPTIAACGFASEQGRSAEEVLSAVTTFKGTLQQVLREQLEGLPVPPLGQLVRKLRAVRRRAEQRGKQAPTRDGPVGNVVSTRKAIELPSEKDTPSR